MKKIIALIITFCVLAGLTGCGVFSKKTPNPNDLKKSPCACDPLGKEFKKFGEV